MSTTTAQALDELVRQVAEGVLGGDFLTVACLATCQLCRNHLLYLLDTLPLSETDGSARIAARLAALPLVHPDHSQPGHPDSAPPQIRWILT